ncbi:M23 family metallopeptidase [Microbacterium sp. H83]|uniref:M23 family metallopeptidase n=1 Tax=Microbacterium sp. H83 TaxID=1827324 RepID=UPI0007F40E7B|nr:M23 family metallopeptidase [Microbacterium sp. H83]OAN36644.1 peptidase [Microbacterium sp. H83]
MTQGPFALELPFTGRWLVQNSPASRVPSHGTALFGTAHAIDFVPVDAEGRSAPRTLAGRFATERPETFIGFGRPLLAPAPGEVVIAHDGEPDHGARRGLVASVWYALTQASRVREGAAAVAGNHVVIRSRGSLVLLAHLRSGSVRVRAGDEVRAGDPVGECGNSGNSTEPHLHVQVSDSVARDGQGIPLVFLRPGGEPWVPRNGEIVEV